VLHLHFSRVVLLVPRTAIVTLARYLQEPGHLRKAASQQGALQAEREISEWAQQDGVSYSVQKRINTNKFSQKLDLRRYTAAASSGTSDATQKWLSTNHHAYSGPL
jgi:hypothetical protein